MLVGLNCLCKYNTESSLQIVKRVYVLGLFTHCNAEEKLSGSYKKGCSQ